ncbi:MAG TPA: haloacid dehalogenase-like hydrolase [Candidatus Hydrogenedentes bacterium]|nr:haloacid dehalogenase-like hydrolase [Candidatus Hydrogenedentota bacterium]
MQTHDATEQVLAALADADYDHLLLDFDHTLFLNNSTERFLDSLRPRLPAFLLVAASDWFVRALAWFGVCDYNAQRDFARVLVCALLMPWNHFIWSAAARRLANNSMNRKLVDALPPDKPLVVLSYGFRHIIKPILDAAGLEQAILICSRIAPRPENLRATGKPAALEKYAPHCNPAQTLFITDSHDDDAVAALVKTARVVQWVPYAPPAFEGYYVPMRYTVEGKYADARYFTYQILLEDFALLLLAYAFSPWYAAALWFLFLSLYAVYEIGYYENDHVAAAREAKPVVSDAARRFAAPPRLEPWLWAFLSGGIGILLARHSVWSATLARDFGLWCAVLICVRGVFFAFNRLAPINRVPLFPLLHTLKTFSFVLFIPVTLVGALLLIAQVASISLNYVIYRFGCNLDRFNRHTWRLLLFLAMLAVAIALAPTDVNAAVRIRIGIILLWCAVRAIERARRRNIVGIVIDKIRGKDA